MRLWPNGRYIPQANELVNRFSLQCRQHCFQSGQIAMNIGQQRNPHVLHFTQFR
jgi:hypothetical protein